MKTIKILCLLLVFSAATFYSCSDSDPIENNNVVTQKSVAMRTALNEMKKANDIGKPANTSGRTATNPFCFEFVYPITFAFNNGTLVTVANFQGLIDVLSNESPSFYLEGMVFPFQITQGGAVITIHNDSDFNAVLANCGFNTLVQDLQYTYCFDLVFPINVTVNNQTYAAVNLVELIDQLSIGAQIVYPISVNYEGQVVTINSLYELFDMINNCSGCICTMEYAPVCVQTSTGIQEFGNMCFAECAGYTQNDLVPCNGNPICSISNITVTVGNCVSSGTSYMVTLDFDYANVGNATYFEVYVDGTILGTYPLGPVPTQLVVPNSTSVWASVMVKIPGVDCVGYTQWAVPNCGSCNCPTNVDPVCVQTSTGLVQYNNACLAICAGHSSNEFITCGVAPNNFGTQLGTCFNLNYPIEVGYQGQIVLVHNNGELLQYWFPAQGAIPNMIYPITATFGNSVYTFGSQAAFQAQIAASCP